MDYEEIPINTIHVTGDGETDTKARTRRLWKEKEEEILFRIWGRDNWRLTRHGKNTVFFAKWADEMREQHNIVVRPEEIQTKVNQTRCKFRQVKRLLAMDRNAPKWKKFELVSLILKNQYRPDGAEPVPLESLERNRDISPSELHQVATGVCSPAQTNTSGGSTMPLDVEGIDVSHEQLDTSIAFNNHNISGNIMFSNDDSRRHGVGDLLVGDGGGLFSDPIVALNDDEIRNNFMHYQYQQEKQEVPQQILEKLKSENGQLNEAEQTYLERQIYNEEADMMISATMEEMKPNQEQRQNKQEENQNIQDQQQQQCNLYDQNQSYTQPSVVVLNTSANLLSGVGVKCTVAHAQVSDTLPSESQPSDSQPSYSEAQDLQTSDPQTNIASLPRLISTTTEPSNNSSWGMPGTQLTTSMTFAADRPVTTLFPNMGKPIQKTGVQPQQPRKRRMPLKNGGDSINGVGHGDSMEMLYLNEVKKKNMLLEEQSDISRKRLELERRKVMLMEQFFPKCLQMQEQILSKLNNRF